MIKPKPKRILKQYPVNLSRLPKRPPKPSTEDGKQWQDFSHQVIRLLDHETRQSVKALRYQLIIMLAFIILMILLSII